jgi:hypothetical protein
MERTTPTILIKVPRYYQIDSLEEMPRLKGSYALSGESLLVNIIGPHKITEVFQTISQILKFNTKDFFLVLKGRQITDKTSDEELLSKYGDVNFFRIFSREAPTLVIPSLPLFKRSEESRRDQFYKEKNFFEWIKTSD